MAKLLLSQVLKAKGLSKRQFAMLLGVEYNNVFRYFRPGFDPKLSSLEKWARVLKVRISDLYSETRPRRK